MHTKILKIVLEITQHDNNTKYTLSNNPPFIFHLQNILYVHVIKILTLLIIYRTYITTVINVFSKLKKIAGVLDNVYLAELVSHGISNTISKISLHIFHDQNITNVRKFQKLTRKFASNLEITHFSRETSKKILQTVLEIP